MAEREETFVRLLVGKICGSDDGKLPLPGGDYHWNRDHLRLNLVTNVHRKCTRSPVLFHPDATNALSVDGGSDLLIVHGL